MKRKLKQHQWRDSYRTKVDADVAGAALDSIKKRHGRVDAGVVVEESRPDDAPLHPAFTWDDEVAAERYRRHEASTLIRAIRVAQPDDAPSTPKYVLVKSESSGAPASYEDATVVVRDADLFADAVRRLEREARALRESVNDLERMASEQSETPERMVRIAVAAKALDALSAAVAGLH